MRPELAAGVQPYHVSMSRERVTGVRVKAPRHLIVYRSDAAQIEVLRVLHDSSDLRRHF